ncbi:MAG: hypothetical protein ABJA78_12130 [Ferruginibacter sp.]
MQSKMTFDFNNKYFSEAQDNNPNNECMMITNSNSANNTITVSSFKKNPIQKMKMFRYLFPVVFFLLPFAVSAQVNSVEFGKNRVQFKKFKWKYYQTKNFNVYFYKDGQELAKYVAQVAEKELPNIETKSANSLQRRANIVLYNEYADYQQSNIGLGEDWQNTGGTKLVNNKMALYFEADHAKLRLQIRQGIARILVDNDLFGEDIGEFAGNQALLDLPKWLTDGYVAYLAENWSTELDDQLKNEILSGTYRKFLQFAFDKPDLAGHAFWYYIEERYKKENTHQLLYLSKVYKNMNKACLQVCKKKFKEVMSDFMEYNDDKYYKDIAMRKQYPKGNLVETFDINKRTDYFRFNVNPVAKNNDYVVTKYRKGIVQVIYVSDFTDVTSLLKYGVRTYQNEINPNYPMMAWDDKGTRIAVLYSEEGKLKLFVYDVITKIKLYKLDLTNKFSQIQDMKFYSNGKALSLLMTAVNNGHTDIYTFDLDKEKATAITNDVYDDLDASFVAFPGKTGIIFSSNRPNPQAKSADTVLPGYNRYNIFLVTNFGDKPELNQITQLSHLRFGNARYPMQYNATHFTFASDENGVTNRYAGFFTSLKSGLDTLVLIGDDILRNPSVKEVDSTLRLYKKTDVDSIAVVSVSDDTAYTFPLSNYESSLAETRIAGDSRQVSEVTRQSDEKDLYKIKIDEVTLRRRNVTARPTEYMKKLMYEDRIAKGESTLNKNPVPDPDKKDDVFQNEFAGEKTDSTAIGKIVNPDAPLKNNVLAAARLYDYKPPKFYIENGGAGFSNNVLVTRYQTYANGSGPVQLNSSTPLNALIRVGTSELMEDVKISGGFRISTNLKDNEWLMSYQNYKRRLDWGGTFYRNVQSISFVDQGTGDVYPGRTISNLYQGNVSYPFDISKSIRLSTGIRSDRFVVSSLNPISVQIPSDKTLYSMTKLEYVYDNSHNPATNIWEGLRYKVYLEWNRQLDKNNAGDGPTTYVLGTDIRYYYPIYRNFIWAGRASADFSWGNQKMIYYLGGVDGWLMFGNNTKANGTDRYFNTNNPPAADQAYAFQSLAVNMRGFIQNVANGNNAVVFNSEFRLPVFTTLFNRPINNSFLRNFQIIQFTDLGTAWNGNYNGIKRPEVVYGNGNGGSTLVKIKAGGIGPFAGGYGFGARSELLGYFVKFDAAWQMNGIFKGKPQLYLALGLDF